MQTIRAEDMKSILTSDSRATVINVLDKEDYRAKHIPGTINIPVSSDSFVRDVENQIDSKGDPVVVYCANTECNASDKAAEKLENAGFKDVRDFAAGVKGWEEARYQLEGAKAVAER
jgi:rhodanese-related sulfurtransferase